jgi:hypothetical protein
LKSSNSIITAAWSEPKTEASSYENEDAYVVLCGDAIGSALIAIADGASTSVHAREWAHHLVDAVGDGWTTASDQELDQLIGQARVSFAEGASQTSTSKFVKRKAEREGSKAALLVLVITPSVKAKSAKIRALAIGDCNAVILRPSRPGRVASFPIQQSDAFTASPQLVGSLPQQRVDYRRWSEQLGPEDVILISTDAVAQWVLTLVEQGHEASVFGLLRQLGAPSAGPQQPESAPPRYLRAAILKQRSGVPLREDDLTLVACALAGARVSRLFSSQLSAVDPTSQSGLGIVGRSVRSLVSAWSKFVKPAR